MGVQFKAGRDQVTGQVALFATENLLGQKAGLPFNAKPSLPLAIFTKVGHKAPENIPDTMSAPDSLPLLQVAENVADILNHKMPQHRLSSAHEAVYYSRSAHGLILRTKAEGISAPALMMTVSTKSSVADLGHDVLARMDGDFMKKLCDTLQPDNALKPAPAAAPAPAH